MKEFDDQVFSLLQRNGRLSYSELAAMTGLSRAAVTTRVEALIASGALRVVAAPHPELAGLGTVAHISIRTAGPSADLLRTLQSTDSVVLLLSIAGSHNLVMEAWLPAPSDLYALIASITEFPCVEGVSTVHYLEVQKGIFMPSEPLPTDLKMDDKHWKLMRELQDDGRLSYRELAERLGLSPTAVRHRVQFLLANRVVKIGATLNRSRRTGTAACGVGLNFRGDGAPLLDQLREAPSIEFLARTIGRFDAILTVAAESTSALARIVEGVRSHSSVRRCETWVHMETLKERYEWADAFVDQPPTPNSP